MDFRKETRGANATKAVDLVISFYDKSIAKGEDGKIRAHYGEAYGHPDSELAKGQTNLALVTQRTERDGKTQFNNSVPFYEKQVNAIKEAAGDNTAPLLSKDGERLGTIYGVKADLQGVERDKRVVGFMPNTTTLQPSELSVAAVDGKDIRTRTFEAAKAARDAAEAAKGAQTKTPEAQVETPEAQVEATERELV